MEKNCVISVDKNKNILSYSCSGKWKDIEDNIIKELDNCLSLTILSNAFALYKSLITEINQSGIFFHCENGCGKTRISLKLSNGTEFASLLIDDSMDTISEDDQHEILEALLELCEKATECIEKRIPIVKEMNRKATVNSIIFTSALVCLIVEAGIILLQYMLGDKVL